MTELSVVEKQRLFVSLLAKLIVFIESKGYFARGGELWRTPEQAAMNAKTGAGIANSLHIQRLAIDLLIDDQDGDWMKDSASYKFAGDYWKSLHPLCCWGGDFKKPDGNHFSITHGGVK